MRGVAPLTDGRGLLRGRHRRQRRRREHRQRELVGGRWDGLRRPGCAVEEPLAPRQLLLQGVCARRGGLDLRLALGELGLGLVQIAESVSKHHDDG